MGVAIHVYRTAVAVATQQSCLGKAAKAFFPMAIEFHISLDDKFASVEVPACESNR
jgi:hypothetical protein